LLLEKISESKSILELLLVCGLLSIIVRCIDRH
jgi:hypothetical protein